MKNEFKHKDTEDIFADKIKQRFDRHQIPADEDIWASINDQLHPQKEKKKGIVLWPWFSGAAVAVFITLLVIPFSISDKQIAADGQITGKTGINTESEELTSMQSNAAQEELLCYNTETTENKSIEKHIEYSSDTAPATTGTDINISTAAAPTPTSDYKILNNGVVAESEEKTDEFETDIKKQSGEQNENEVNEPEIFLDKYQMIDKQVTERYIPEADREENIKEARDNWQLAAVFNSSSSNSYGNNSYDNSSGDNRNDAEINSGHIPSKGHDGIMRPEDFSDISYFPSMSFGLNVRKNMGKHWGVETGLVYTYLHTDFEKKNGTRVTADLNLHYLGIPLEAVFQFLNNEKWNIYLTAGGMLEKGIRSNYSQYTHYSNLKQKISLSANINGLQWSLRSSAGVGYKLVKKLAIYAEPSFSYYFKNEQPISIRTKNPYVFGINAGLRYDF